QRGNLAPLIRLGLRVRGLALGLFLRGHQRFAFLFLALIGRDDVVRPLAQVFRAHVGAVVRRFRGLLPHEFISREILRRFFLQLVQRRGHFLLARYYQRYGLADIYLAFERVVSHRVDGFDDLRVIFQRVVNEQRPPRFRRGHELPHQLQTRLCELDVQRQPHVWLLRHADLIDLVLGQKVAFLRDAQRRERQRAGNQKNGEFHWDFRL